LSGGERGRLALALLARQGANFLLLDEPTNHLDLPAQEVLQTVLEQYEGTILLISHDRYLINQLATEIWELRDGYLHSFAGSYQEFVTQGEGKEQPLRVTSDQVLA
jgi:ATP-binding cassette, subfamily F, member 3